MSQDQNHPTVKLDITIPDESIKSALKNLTTNPQELDILLAELSSRQFDKKQTETIAVYIADVAFMEFYTEYLKNINIRPSSVYHSSIRDFITAIYNYLPRETRSTYEFQSIVDYLNKQIARGDEHEVMATEIYNWFPLEMISSHDSILCSVLKVASPRKAVSIVNQAVSNLTRKTFKNRELSNKEEFAHLELVLDEIFLRDSDHDFWSEFVEIVSESKVLIDNLKILAEKSVPNVMDLITLLTDLDYTFLDEIETIEIEDYSTDDHEEARKYIAKLGLDPDDPIYS